jgi:hypothetical protein
LPADVLEARTVLVIVDPEAGFAAEHLNANRMAREDVESALIVSAGGLACSTGCADKSDIRQ